MGAVKLELSPSSAGVIGSSVDGFFSILVAGDDRLENPHFFDCGNQCQTADQVGGDHLEPAGQATDQKRSSHQYANDTYQSLLPIHTYIPASSPEKSGVTCDATRWPQSFRGPRVPKWGRRLAAGSHP
jgi:hypothetical protein